MERIHRRNLEKMGRSFMGKVFVSLLAIAVVNTGCLLKPDFRRPVVLGDAGYRNTLETGSAANIKWWELFKDEALRNLITTALNENRDLKVALARIDEARALLGVVRPDQFPRLDLAGAASRTSVSESISGGLPGVSPRNEFGLLGRLGFEVDIWGRYASATEVQRAELVASEEFFKAVTLSLVASVATAYIQLLDFDRQVIIAERTLKSRRANTKLIDERFKQGYTAKIDLNQAQIQEQDAAAALVAIKRGRQLTENALSVLMGRVPQLLYRSKPDTDPLALKNIPAGVPADLLSRRPDVRAAEERARAAVMRIGVARATQFPSISLLGVVGLNSTQSTELFTADGRTWSIGGNLLGPLIDLGKSWSRTDAAEASADQALKEYEGVVLRAVREVEDAMVSVRTFNQEHRIRQTQVMAARSADELSRRRYTDGVTSYLEVLSTQESLFSSELAMSNTQGRYLAAIVDLYKALGGGWELPNN
jgi:multidrug efflux system outer membrane protein